MLRRTLLLALTLSLLSSPAFAIPDRLLPDGTDWARSQKPVWQSMTTLDANTNTFPVRQSINNAFPACFGWDTMVSFSSGNAATCCFTLTSSATLGSQTTFHASELTDVKLGQWIGYGACVTVPANFQPVRVMPDWQALTNQGATFPGTRPNVCSAQQSTKNDLIPYRPFCQGTGTNGNSDCTKAGVTSGTCLAQSQTNAILARQQGCAFAVCRGTTASQVLSTEIGR